MSCEGHKSFLNNATNQIWTVTLLTEQKPPAVNKFSLVYFLTNSH